MQILATKITYGIKHYSKGRTQALRNDFYSQRPHIYKNIASVKQNFDYKTVTQFPINVPLKRRWVYSPDLVEAPPVNDFLRFDQMTGNQILLHLQEPEYLRPSELVDAINTLAKKYPDRKEDIRQHEWVVKTMQEIDRRWMHLKQEEFMGLVMAYYKLELKEKFQWIEQRLMEKFINKVSIKSFQNLYLIAFRTKDYFSQEFRDHLVSVLPNYLRKFDYKHMGFVLATIQDNNYMNEYLFDRHFHQILWKQPQTIAVTGSLPTFLRVFKEMKYEHDEFLYPTLYKSVLGCVHKIPTEYLPQTEEAIIDFARTFESHSQYLEIDEIIKKIREKLAWENGLGKQAKELNLVEIVKLDLQFYKEKAKLQIEQQQV